MTSLITLDLCGCLRLEDLPLLGYTSVSAENIDLIPLSIELYGDQLMSSYNLDSLIFLDLGFCNLSTVADAIGELRHLERLNLEGNNFVSLPTSMERLYNLAYLNLAHCRRLQSLPELSLCATSPSGGRYFKTVSGSHNHRSGLYIFNCPSLEIPERVIVNNLALQWLANLVENPCHFRCGFDIVVPSSIIPRCFVTQFTGGSRVKLTESVYEYENWLGFAFCVKFEKNYGPTMSGSSNYSISSLLKYPFYLSFESENTEETFDMPLRLDLDKVPVSYAKHLWLIYISRPHCHFLTTRAYIRFKAHPGYKIKEWGLHMVFEHDIFYPSELWGNIEVDQLESFDYGHESSSSGNGYVPEEEEKPRIKLPYNWYATDEKENPKIQLPYNWHAAEEEQIENMQVNAKGNTLSNMGLSIGDD